MVPSPPLAGVEVGFHLGIQGPIDGGAAILARPKSKTLTRPSPATITFAGFRSRWTMPLAWAAARASASGSADLEDPVDVHPTLGDEVIEGLPFDELHRQEMHAVGLLDRVHADHSGVVERGQHGGLATEAIQPLRVGGHFGRQDLEGDIPPSLVSVARHTSPIPPAPRAAVMR